MNNALNPCPFCGSNKLKIETKLGRKYYNKQRITYSVRCMVCHARGGTSGGDVPDDSYKDIEQRAVNNWNMGTE